MNYLPDTNACIRYWDKPASSVVTKFKAAKQFGGAAADICGRIRAELASVGTPIGLYDLQIAAIALANGLTLGTHNTREFSRVPGLLLEDWET